MKLSGRIPHDKRCPVAKYESGECSCYLSEVAQLEEEIAALKKENDDWRGVAADIAYSEDMTLEIAQKKAARKYSFYVMGLVAGPAEMWDSGELDDSPLAKDGK